MKPLLATSALARLRATRSGFTLLEIIVVMCIMMLMVGIGVASFSYFGDKDPFEEPTEKLRSMSKYTLQACVIQHQSMNIGFDKTGFALIGDTSGEGTHYSLPGNMKMWVMHWGGNKWEKAEGHVWRFGEQGICEPIKIRFANETDHLEIGFHPLTGVPLP